MERFKMYFTILNEKKHLRENKKATRNQIKSKLNGMLTVRIIMEKL